jgi:hypothetical protein
MQLKTPHGTHLLMTISPQSLVFNFDAVLLPVICYFIGNDIERVPGFPEFYGKGNGFHNRFYNQKVKP